MKRPMRHSTGSKWRREEGEVKARRGLGQVLQGLMVGCGQGLGLHPQRCGSPCAELRRKNVTWRLSHWCRGTEATEEAVTGPDQVEVVKRR